MEYNALLFFLFFFSFSFLIYFLSHFFFSFSSIQSGWAASPRVPLKNICTGAGATQLLAAMAWASPSRLHGGPSGAAALHASPQPTRDGVRPRASVPARPAAASRAPRRQSTAEPKNKKVYFIPTSQPIEYR
jgi:hypothetical protein